MTRYKGKRNEVLAQEVAPWPRSKTLRLWRKMAGLTQEQAGFMFGISRRQWSRWETGRVKVPADLLADALGVLLSWGI